jgi:hypothetical protein
MQSDSPLSVTESPEGKECMITGTYEVVKNVK